MTARQPRLYGERFYAVTTCGRLLTPEQPCPTTATAHVFWNLDTDNGIVCPEHADEAAQRWDPVQVHDLGADCVMPDSVWLIEEHRCVVPLSDPELAELTTARAALEGADR